MIKCHRSVIWLKSFFAVLQSRLHKALWLLIYLYPLTLCRSVCV